MSTMLADIYEHVHGLSGGPLSSGIPKNLFFQACSGIVCELRIFSTF